MSTILAIETSTRTGSVALACDGAVVAESRFAAERSHNAQIFAPLRALLESTEAIDGIVVGTGPGSYTGVRIGISCGIGISLSKGVPLAGMPSVCALEEPGGYWVVGDARRGMVFRCRVEGSGLVGAPVLSDRSGLSELSDQQVFTFDDVPPIPFARPAVPSAGALARLGSLLAPEEFAALGSVPVEPIYLAPAFVTTPGKRRDGGSLSRA